MPSTSRHTSGLRDLSKVPLAGLIEAATARLRRASIDELVAIVNGEATSPATPDALAKAVLALPTPGSKLDAVQSAVVLHAFAVSNGNVAAAARLLGMERKAYTRKLARARRKR